MNLWQRVRQLWLPRTSKRRRLVRTGYYAADQGRLHVGWPSTPVPADAYIKQQLKILRARSRERVRNDPYAARFKGLVVNNVVGPHGIAMQSRVQLSKTGQPDTAANNAIEEAWQRWGEGACDLSGRASWIDMQRAFMGTVLEDGEIIVHKVPSASNDFRYALELIDPEMLDVDYNVERMTDGGNYIRMSVECDRHGKPVAYHFRDFHATADSYYSATMAKNYRRIPANRIIHAFMADRLDQSRGVPWMSVALERMEDLTKYLEAALVNARQGASNMGIITTEDGVSYKGDDTDSAGSPLMDIEPGMVAQLAEGQTFQAYDPTYPEGELPLFAKAMLRSIASSLNISYVSLSGDLESVNYSSARVGLLEERDRWIDLQSWMTRVFCVPIYREWLFYALNNKQIMLGKTPLKPANYDYYNHASWQGRRWAWIDPLKDSQANIANIAAGLMTPSEAIRERGRDPEDVWNEYESDKARLDALGIAINPDGEASEEFDEED
jgi:lambda family phage portal protein